MPSSTPAPRLAPDAPAFDPSAPARRPAEAWDLMVERELRAATGDPDLALDPSACGRRPCRMLVRPPRDLAGLALSGGGNRSATFNLGLLQGLDDLNLLPAFDYLSTVSGGGYVGGFWSAWMSRQRPGEERRNAFPVGGAADVRAEAPEVRHLRQFSNFLSPEVSLLSWDTGRMVSAAVSGLVPAFAAAVALMALALGLWRVEAWALTATARGSALAAGVAVAAPLAGLLAASEAVWRRSKPGDAAPLAYVWSSVWALLVAGIVWALVARSWLAVPQTRGVVLDRTLLLAPAFVCAVAGAKIAVVRMLFSTRRPVTPGLRAHRSASERVLARVLLGGLVWCAGGALWLAGAKLAAAGAGTSGAAPAGAAGVLALLAALFARVQKFIAYLPKGSSDRSRARRLAPLAPQVLAYAILGGLATLVAAALVAAYRLPPADLSRLTPGLVLPAPCLAYGAAVLVVLLTLRFFDPNTVGLHAFYRARLARAYLGASNVRAGREYDRAHRDPAAPPRLTPDAPPDDAGGRQSEEQPDDDLPLPALAHQRPVHLVCCAANDLAPNDPVANLRRGARSAVLSAFGFGVGDAATGWAGDGTGASEHWAPSPAIDPLRGPLPPETLGAAMTASAAAFNSHMGALSVRFGPAVTFLMTALNLRLGRWLPHPEGWRRGVGPLARQPGYKFYAELFGQSCAEGASVHLSDGAHFENLAVYELVRRQCRYVLVSDCGADPEVAFDDFGTLVRRVRQDFGAEIDIDLSALRPGPDGRARQHMVAGDIYYPTGDVGVLLYVKPTIVGDEPPDVAQYKTRNPQFPHEGTGDQFYDEAQWESYRRLGVHTARAAFLAIVQRLGLTAAARGSGVRRDVWGEGPVPSDAARDTARREGAARVFSQARRQWQPLPAGFAERAPAIAERCAELDAALHAHAAAARESRRAQRPPADAGDPLRAFYWEFDAVADRPDVPAAALEDTLPLVRRAALCMEEIFHSEALAYNPHSVYGGTINYFARWAALPAMRFWWPVLRALHAPAFTAYAERQFNLPGPAADPGDDGALRYRLAERPFTGAGYVERCWRERGGHEPRPDEVRLELTAALPWGEGAVEVAVAQLLVRLAPAAAAAPPATGAAAAAFGVRRLAVFDADWLFVPPGLWGVGTAEVLLARCGRADAEALRWASGLLVRVPRTPRFGLASRRETAAITRLYRSRGFEEVYPDASGAVAVGHPGRAPAGALVVETAGLLPEPDGPDRTLYRWLYRPAHHAPAPGGPDDRPDDGGPDFVPLPPEVWARGMR